MLHAILSGLLLFCCYAAVGFAPAAMALQERPSGPCNLLEVLCLAPAFGVALTGLIAFPLYRFIGPASTWAIPVTLVLLLLAVYPFLRIRGHWTGPAGLRRDAIGIAICLCLVAGFLVAIAVQGGFTRVVFGFNPSDAVSQMSMAETTRVAPWDALWNGRFLNLSDATAALLSYSDTSLYSARVVQTHTRLGTSIDIAWFSVVSGVPVDRAVFPFAMGSILALVPASYWLCRTVDAPRWLAAAASLAIAIGPWGTLIRDHDAQSQAQVIPVLIALTAVRFRSSFDRPASLLVSGALVAAVGGIYTEFFVFIFALLIGECILYLAFHRRLARSSLEPAAVLLIAMIVLLVTGQGDYLGQGLLTEIAFVTKALTPIGSVTFETELYIHPFATVTGSVWLLRLLPRAANQIENVSFFVVLLAMLTSLYAVLSGQRKWIVLSAPVGLAALLSLNAALWQRDPYVFFKIFGTSAPLITIFIVAAVSRQAGTLHPATGHLGKWIRGAAGAALAALTIGALGFSVFYLSQELAGKPPADTTRWKAIDFDMTAVVAAIKKHRPANLLVFDPPTERWWDSALAMFPLKPFTPFHQAGYLIDNRPVRMSFPQMIRTAPFDYALVAVGTDYLRGRDNVEKVWSNGRYVLYRVLTDTEDLHQYRSAF